MKFLHEFEKKFFEEGPSFCKRGAVITFVSGIALSSLFIFLSKENPQINHFRFVALMAIPSILLAILSSSIERKHWLTIPLVLSLCGFIIRYFLVNPDLAFEGINIGAFPYIIGWIVYAAEVVALIFAVFFMWYLWSKQAFH